MLGFCRDNDMCMFVIQINFNQKVKKKYLPLVKINTSESDFQNVSVSIIQ